MIFPVQNIPDNQQKTDLLCGREKVTKRDVDLVSFVLAWTVSAIVDLAATLQS